MRLSHLFAAALFAALPAACSSSQRHAGAPGAPSIDVPEHAASYSTDAQSDGVRGGSAAAEAEAELVRLLEARGDEAEPDGALADTAAWLLRSAYQRVDLSNPMVGTNVALQFGFAGEFNGWMTGSLAADDGTRALELLVSQVPKGSVTNRYGIVAGQGRDVAIVLGAVQVSLDDFPRSFAPGSTLRLNGELSERFQRASVFSTTPDGNVREIPMAARAIDASVALRAPGVHKLEVMGYGPTGPVVLVNVPIYVGVPPRSEADLAPGPAAEPDPNLTTEEAEAILLALLNEERTKRGLPKAEPDPELRAVALAHSVDMADNHYFSHVSPTTGTPDDRAAKAGIHVTQIGECIGGHPTPQGAHRGLMDSPAHRAAMLDPIFGHVGIGVAFENVGHGTRRLAVTLLFARRPPPGDARLTTPELLQIIQAQRKSRDLPPLQVDPTLTAAANAAHRARTSGAAKTTDQMLAASARELQSIVNRTRVARSSCQSYYEINDRYLLTLDPLLERADMRSIGIATVPVQTAKGPMLGVLLLMDGGPGKPTSCK